MKNEYHGQISLRNAELKVNRFLHLGTSQRSETLRGGHAWPFYTYLFPLPLLLPAPFVFLQHLFRGAPFGTIGTES